MRGRLTHPAKESFGPGVASLVDPLCRLRQRGREMVILYTASCKEGCGIGWCEYTGVDAWRVDSPSKGALRAGDTSLADPLYGKP
jgi:hypothetical protein